jgi:hypothetical protein
MYRMQKKMKNENSNTEWVTLIQNAQNTKKNENSNTECTECKKKMNTQRSK